MFIIMGCVEQKCEILFSFIHCKDLGVRIHTMGFVMSHSMDTHEIIKNNALKDMIVLL